MINNPIIETQSLLQYLTFRLLYNYKYMAAFINRDHVGPQCHDIGCFPQKASLALYGVETIPRPSHA